jgi:hypothetical protein
MTQTMCDYLKLNYPTNKLIINPDASGNARNFE